MLEQQDDRGDGEVRAERGHKLRVDVRLPDVLEAAGYVAQDLDRVLALLVCAVPAVQECGKGEDDDDEGVPEDGDEEEQASCTCEVRLRLKKLAISGHTTPRVALAEPIADNADKVQRE